jgi:nucleosome binding factor SPN SPT16 subunit
MDYQINAERFYQRLGRLVDNWYSHKTTLWGSVDAICIPNGANVDNDASNISKSASMQLHLLGYEIPDSIIVITKTSFWFMATEKKCNLLEGSLGSNATSPISFNVLKRSKDEAMNKENMTKLVNVIRKGGGNKIGSIFKAEYHGTFIPSWLTMIDENQLEKIDVATSIGLYLSVKDEAEMVSIFFNELMVSLPHLPYRIYVEERQF